MALQLETLVFSVEDKALDEARIKIAKLGDAVNSLNKPLQDMQRSSAKTAEAIAKSELAAEKARVAKEKLADSASTVTAKVDPLTKLMEKLSNTYTDMAAGMTRGESSILNQARSYGAMGDQLKAVADILQNIKTLNKDPFDASLGGVRSITQEFEKLQQRADLAAQGILMTTKQLGEYSKLAAEARGRVVGLGMDPDSLEGQKVYNQLLSQSQKEYLDVLSVVKQLTDAEQQRLAVAKEQERLQKAAASASAARMQEWAKGVGGKSPELSSMAAFYKEQEVAARKLTAAEDDLILREQKLAFVNKELAAGLTTASANALFKYKKDLEALGKSTDEISRRTATFRAGLVEKQGHSPIKKIADDAAEARKQVDHLARALGPQITDIFVGLATGQSPMMVLLQQGGQLRDQFALAGVEAGNMGESLRTAASYMITSIKDVAVAIGQLLVSAVVGAGKKITELSLAMVGMSDAFAALSTRAPALATGIAAIVGILGGAFLASTIALGVAFFKVQKSLDDLTKSLTLTGGSLGLTTDSAVSLAISMEDVGISSSKAMAAIQAMAKEGGFARSEIQMITQSSVEMQKYLGVAVEDTVKQFAKLKGEPVDALLEVAKTTGMIPPEIIATVMALKDQGKEAEAVAIAMKAYVDATVEQVQRAKTEYTDFGRFMIELGGTIASFWDTIKSVVIKASPTQELENLRAEMQRNLDFSFTDTQKKYWSAQLESVNRQILRQQELNSAVEQERVANVKNARVLEEARKIEIASMDTLEKLRRNKQIAEDRIANAKKDSDLNQVARNAIISASEKEILKINEDIAKEVKKNNSERDKEAKKHQEEIKKALNLYEDIIGISGGVTKSYNDQVSALELLRKEGKITAEELAIAIGKLEEQQPRFKELVKNFEEYDKAVQSHLTTLFKLKDENEIENQQLELRRLVLGKTEEQQRLITIEYEKNIKLKKIDIELEKELKRLRDSGLTGEDLRLASEKTIKEFAAKRVLAEQDANLKIAEDYMKKFEALQKELGDVMFLALTNRGASAGKKLRDLIKAELMKPITVVINAVIGEVFGGAIASVLGALGINVPAGLTGNAGSIIKGVSSAKDIYSTVTGGFNPVGAATSLAFNKFATSSFGQSLGLSQQVQVPVTDISATGGAPVTETVASTQMTELGNSMSASLGQIATSTASMVAGVAMRKMFSGGYSMGKGMETAQSIAMAAAEFFFPGIGGAVAGAVSGLMNRAFGRKLKEVGIVGTFGGEQGFTGQQYKYEKGGLFRSDKTSYSALDQDTTDSLTKSFRAIQIAVGTLATSLGASTKSIEDFSYSMKLNLKGLSDLDIQKKITAEFTTMQEKMSQGVLQEWAKTKVKIDPAVQARIDEINSKLQGSVVLSLGDIFNNPISWLGFIKNSKLRRELNGITEDIAAQADDVWKSLLRTVDDKGTMETAVQLLERLSNTLATVNGAFDTLGYSLLQLSIDSAVLATNLTDAFGGVDKFSESMSFFYKNFYTEQERTTTLTRQLTTAFAKLGYELPKTTYEFRDLMQVAIEGGNYGLAASLGKLQTSFIELVGPVGQLEESFKQLTNGILEEINRLRGAILGDAGVSGSVSGLTAEFAMLTAQAKSGNTAALEKLPEYSQAIEQAVAASAVNAADVAYARAWLAESLGNTRAVLNGTSPSIVSTAITQDVSGTTAVNGATALTSSASSQSDLIAILVAEIQGLRAEVRADVAANNKTAKILERANQDGETISVTVAA